MKVTVARVVSFGSMRDRVFELSPGLNVFYGPNEAGKSTLRSFITTTMFPKAPVKYPVPKGSDSGSLDVVLENGHRMVFQRDGKRSSGLGSELCRIDDREYVSIYSLTPDDLRDVKGIEKGDIRNRFLTIPGGRDLPSAYEELDEERTRLLPEVKRSAKCEIACLIQNEHELSVKVRQMQSRESGDNQYSVLASRRKALQADIERTGIELKRCDRVRAASQMAAGRANDLSNIEKLKAREAELAYSENVDESRLKVMDAELLKATKAANAAKQSLSAMRIELGGREPETFLRNRDRIEQLERMSVDYDFYQRQREQRPVTREPAKKGRGLPLVAVGGAVVAVAGIAVAVTASFAAGAAVAAVGVIIAVIGLRRPRPRPARQVQRPVPTEADGRIRNIETLLDSVAADTRIERRGFHADVGLLRTCLKRADDYSRACRAWEDAERERKEADDSIDLFLSGYNGRAGFEQTVKDSKELVEVRSKLSALIESAAGAEKCDVSAEEAERQYDEVSGRHRQLTAELAKVEQAMEDIAGNESVEDAITAMSDAGDEVYAACYRWARLMLEKIILDEASSEAYGNQRPDVLRRADRYLSDMTSGRYCMNTDPRVDEITVIDTGSRAVKTMKECSSGLEDQVKLSIKMAVSLSLSEEKPPVILDDVLLTSDSQRKKDACTAMADLAKDIQVLYFTCDRETRDFLRMSGAKVLEV